MKNILILLTMALLCTSCHRRPEAEIRHEDLVMNLDRLKDIQYIKDNNTGLCFAVRDLEFAWALFTNVPCTPEVEKLLNK